MSPDNSISAHELAREGKASALRQLLDSNPGLISSKDQTGRTPLHYAVKHSRELATRVLLALEADVNAPDPDGITPLHFAAQFAPPGDVSLLLIAGAEPNVKDGKGFTPLHEAARNGRTKIVKMLVANNADVRAKTHQGALSETLAAENGHKRIAQLLADQGLWTDEQASELQLVPKRATMQHDVSESFKGFASGPSGRGTAAVTEYKFTHQFMSIVPSRGGLGSCASESRYVRWRCDHCKRECAVGVTEATYAVIPQAVLRDPANKWIRAKYMQNKLFSLSLEIVVLSFLISVFSLPVLPLFSVDTHALGAAGLLDWLLVCFGATLGAFAVFQLGRFRTRTIVRKLSATDFPLLGALLGVSGVAFYRCITSMSLQGSGVWKHHIGLGEIHTRIVGDGTRGIENKTELRTFVQQSESHAAPDTQMASWVFW